MEDGPVVRQKLRLSSRAGFRDQRCSLVNAAHETAIAQQRSRLNSEAGCDD
jgi:hypothetical protein